MSEQTGAESVLKKTSTVILPTDGNGPLATSCFQRHSESYSKIPSAEVTAELLSARVAAIRDSHINAARVIRCVLSDERNALVRY